MNYNQVMDYTTSSVEVEVPVLRAEKVSVYYGLFLAVKDVYLDIPKNQVTAFIGPSGCGKSTLLRCFNRLNDLIPGARVTGRITFQIGRAHV